MVGLQIVGRRGVEHRSSADVEACGVQRTLDHFAIEPPVGQAGIGVSANIISRKEAAISGVECNRAAFDFDPEVRDSVTS